MHLHVGDGGKVERHAAPAAADLEHALAGLEQELGRDVALLGGLRLLERLVAGGEVGAGILHVPVEPQAVEGVAEVVMVRDVLPRPAARVVLGGEAGRLAGREEQPLDRRACRCSRLPSAMARRSAAFPPSGPSSTTRPPSMKASAVASSGLSGIFQSSRGSVIRTVTSGPCPSPKLAS
jgi:hypothetical protein